VRIINLFSLFLTLLGGVLIHGTVIAFNSFFEKDEDATGFEI
jgi:heme O synthase-like polyprenyltransferase